MTRHPRRTKAAYANLFDDPGALFGPGARVILFPNGGPEIWIEGPSGHGFAITASAGPAGFGLSIRSFAGAAPITVTGTTAAPDAAPFNADDVRYLELCQHRPDPWSQAFKRWYTDPTHAPYPGDAPDEAHRWTWTPGGPPCTCTHALDHHTAATISPTGKPGGCYDPAAPDCDCAAYTAAEEAPHP